MYLLLQVTRAQLGLARTLLLSTYKYSFYLMVSSSCLPMKTIKTWKFCVFVTGRSIQNVQNRLERVGQVLKVTSAPAAGLRKQS